jgi:hypothetical protein
MPQYAKEIAVSPIKAILYFVKDFIMDMAEITKQPLGQSLADAGTLRDTSTAWILWEVGEPVTGRRNVWLQALGLRQ